MYHQARGIANLLIAVVLTPAMSVCLRDPRMAVGARSTFTVSLPVSASA